MTSVAVYNDPSTGYARKYTYRQAVIDRLKLFAASVHGMYHWMMREISAAATTGALLAIDTMDIITHAESL